MYILAAIILASRGLRDLLEPRERVRRCGWLVPVSPKTGDWMWFKQCLNLQGWAKYSPTARICWMCLADLSNAYDVRPAAQWRRSLCGMTHILNPGTKDQFVSRFWSIPGTGLGTIRADWMHVCDLGILQSVTGSVFWELFKLLGGSYSSPKGACAKLLNMVKVQARALEIEPPINALTVYMIRVTMKKKPRMRLKAAEGRFMLPILHAILLHCFPATSPYEVLRIRCVQALLSCYEHLRDWRGMESTRALGELARRHVILFMELHTAAGDKKLYLLIPKTSCIRASS